MIASLVKVRAGSLMDSWPSRSQCWSYMVGLSLHSNRNSKSLLMLLRWLGVFLIIRVSYLLRCPNSASSS